MNNETEYLLKKRLMQEAIVYFVRNPDSENPIEDLANFLNISVASASNLFEFLRENKVLFENYGRFLITDKSNTQANPTFEISDDDLINYGQRAFNQILKRIGIKEEIKFSEELYSQIYYLLQEIANPNTSKERKKAKMKEIYDVLGFELPEEELNSNFFRNEQGKIIAKRVADAILEQQIFKTTEDNEIFYYEDGIYKPKAESRITQFAQRLLEEDLTRYQLEEIKLHIRAQTYIRREDLNKDKHLIFLKNGIYDLNERKLIPFSPNFLSTIQLPIIYDSEASCPRFLKFLEDILPNEEDRLGVQELFGYCLLKDYRFQKAFMFVGEGANGKSTLLNVLVSFLGKDNISSISLQDLTKNRFASANLYGKLANIYSDIPSYKIINTGIFKMLTGGDVISAERKFKDRFRFMNFAKLVFSANQLPDVADDTSAYFRRWVAFTFPNKFEGKNADKGLLEKLTTQEEISGIFNWAIEGLDRLLEQQCFSNEIETEKMRVYYEKMANSLKGFANEFVEYDPDSTIPKDEFYSLYVQYCQANKLLIKAKNVVGREIAEIIPEVKETRISTPNGRIRAWKGIRILDVQDVEAPNDLNQEETYKKGENGQDGQDGQVFSYLNIRDKSNNNSFNSHSLKLPKTWTSWTSWTPRKINIKINKPDSTTTTTLHDQILNTIRNLDQQNDGEGAEEGELERIINHPDFSKLFNDMKQNAEVYSPKPSFWKVLE